MFSCNEKRKKSVPAQAIEKTDTCVSDSKNTYEIYIPGRNSNKEKLPLLIIIDSHGEGKFALNKFKPAAEKYNVIIAASNLVKNNFPKSNSAIETLKNDIRHKYPVNKTTFLAGFSGGARISLNYAISHPVNGLIMCGALAEAKAIRAARCTLFSISGTDDFNFNETAQYISNDNLCPDNLKIELTNGNHNWPDSITLTNATGFLLLSFVSENTQGPYEDEIKNYRRKQLSVTDSLQKNNMYLKAYLNARNMSGIKTFDRHRVFTKRCKKIKDAKEYRHELSRIENCLNYEMKIRQPFINAFTTKDSTWWKQENETLKKRIEETNDPYLLDMYKRIKGTLGIYCYALCNMAIRQHNAEALKKIITVYGILEPQNAEMYYYSAFIPYWNGNYKKAAVLIQKAVYKGIKDTDRIKRDFPEEISKKINQDI